MSIETDITQIRILGEIKLKENFEFRSYLKNLDIASEKLDYFVHEINDDIQSQIDCTKCANCCKSIRPILSKKDINTFAEGLNISSKELKDNYCKISEEEKHKFEFNALPCPFLKDDKCTNYEHRPMDCKSYPHLHKEDFKFRLLGIIDNYHICPIVFNVYETLKFVLWDRNWRRNLRNYY